MQIFSSYPHGILGVGNFEVSSNLFTRRSRRYLVRPCRALFDYWWYIVSSWDWFDFTVMLDQWRGWEGIKLLLWWSLAIIYLGWKQPRIFCVWDIFGIRSLRIVLMQSKSAIIVNFIQEICTYILILFSLFS